MIQLIIILSGLMVIAGVIIITGHLNSRKHDRSSLATLTDATTEQVEQFVMENLGKWAETLGGSKGFICGYDSEDADIIFGKTNDEGWDMVAEHDIILKRYNAYSYGCIDGNLSLIKITEKP